MTNTTDTNRDFTVARYRFTHGEQRGLTEQAIEAHLDDVDEAIEIASQIAKQAVNR